MGREPRRAGGEAIKTAVFRQSRLIFAFVENEGYSRRERFVPCHGRMSGSRTRAQRTVAAKAWVLARWVWRGDNRVGGIMEKPRLTRYELELMDVLWRLGQGTVQDVCDNLDRELAYTTVMTTLRLLHSKKKVLKRMKNGRAHVYRPSVSREEVSRSVLTELQDVLFRDRLPTLVLGMLEEGEFSSQDIEAIRAALKKVKAQETRE
jgi:BlaI family transcriptional regulator, penicillinase repressor